MMSSMGLCATYNEVMIFESSVLISAQPTFISGAFCQYVFDNADHNTNTLDGLNTFHSMGGIRCITPKQFVKSNGPINRLKSIIPSSKIGTIHQIAFQTFEKEGKMGFTKIILEDLSRLGKISDYNSLTETWDLIWMCGKHLTLINIPNWSGFMDRITQNLPYEKSQVLLLPFVNQSPSNYNTIYSVLDFASKNISEFNQKTCFVTFDQPLYIKARDIVASCEQNTNISNIIVRLGGFHLLMSFLGCIGFLMAGSGLKDLLSTIYAPISVDKMLTGHAYSRSFRGHVLVQLVLGKLIFKELKLNTDDYHDIVNNLNNFQNDPPKYGQTVVDMTILHTRFNE